MRLFSEQTSESFMARVFEEQKKPSVSTQHSLKGIEGIKEGNRWQCPPKSRLLALVACQKRANVSSSASSARSAPPLLALTDCASCLGSGTRGGAWSFWVCIESESSCARRYLAFACIISRSRMRFTSTNGSGTMPKRPYVSRRAVPSSALGGIGRANGNGIAGGALKWKFIKCALISSGIGLMASALFGVGLLNGSSSPTINTSDGDAASTSSNADTSGVHGVHAVAGRNFLQANRESEIQQKELPEVKNDNEHVIMSPIADEERSPLARGVSGLPLSQTPALVGGKRGHIECDEDVDFLAYWNDPQGTRDREFVSPFAADKNDGEPKYLTFQPDSGELLSIFRAFCQTVAFKTSSHTLVYSHHRN